MEGTVPDLVEALLACADTTRLRILHLLLRDRELCVYDLVDVTGASQPKISRHLAYLRRAGLVSNRKDGLWVYYRIASDTSPPIAILIDSLGAVFATVSELEADLVTLDDLHAKRGSIERRYTALESRTAPRPAALALPEPDARPYPEQSYEDEEEDLEIELL
jgi:ArsR family transcriptional regulator, arsenate/arsenite/antimonite-responsive transcriptional repressor